MRYFVAMIDKSTDELLHWPTLGQSFANLRTFRTKTAGKAFLTDLKLYDCQYAIFGKIPSYCDPAELISTRQSTADDKAIAKLLRLIDHLMKQDKCPDDHYNDSVLDLTRYNPNKCIYGNPEREPKRALRNKDDRPKISEGQVETIDGLTAIRMVLSGEARFE